MKKSLLAFALLLSATAQAQQHHEIGLMAGAANYFGDLQDKLPAKYGYQQMGGIVYKYFVSPRIGFRFGATYTSLTAADSLSDVMVKKERNLSFSTKLFEIHGGFEFNFLPIDVDKVKVTPYVFGGLALFYSNPYTLALNGDKVYLRPLSTEGQGLADYPDRKPYSVIHAAFPFGGGLKFLVGKTLMITTEVGFRYTTTDYLDDVSKSYVDLNKLQAVKGKQSAALSYRGNEVYNWDGNYYPGNGYSRGDSKSNDWYWFSGVTVAIYFEAFGNIGKWWQTSCPKVK